MFRPLKIQSLLAATSTASNATATAQIDTLGYDFVSVGVVFSTVNNTNLPIALKVGEADVTNTSSAADITRLVGAGTGGFTMPTFTATNTAGANTFQFDIDCRSRKRYLLVSATPFTTVNVAVVAALGNAEQGPITATADNLMGRASA